MATRYADNGGVRIAFEELGGTGGDPLLLVMGLGASRFWWPRGLADELVRRGFHVVAYDQRDAGESTRFPGRRRTHPLVALLRREAPAYTAEDLTDDAITVLDALGWKRAHLFGHSMGGLIAQRIAIRHRTRIRTLTSSSAVPSDVRGLNVLRYVRLGTVARFTRLRHPRHARRRACPGFGRHQAPGRTPAARQRGRRPRARPTRGRPRGRQLPRRRGPEPADRRQMARRRTRRHHRTHPRPARRRRSAAAHRSRPPHRRRHPRRPAANSARRRALPRP
ncbi:alpha/beta fold hydrolase [Streptomyces sp. L500]